MSAPRRKSNLSVVLLLALVAAYLISYLVVRFGSQGMLPARGRGYTVIVLGAWWGEDYSQRDKGSWASMQKRNEVFRRLYSPLIWMEAKAMRIDVGAQRLF